MTYPEHQGDQSAASAEKTHPPGKLRRTAVKKWTATGLRLLACSGCPNGSDNLDTTLTGLMALLGLTTIGGGTWVFFKVFQEIRHLFLLDEV